MKSTLTFEHGPMTCASEPGEFCRFVYVSHFGTRWRCNLYDEALHDDGKGWLARCMKCLAEHGRGEA